MGHVDWPPVPASPRRATPDPVLAAVQAYHPKVLHTSLSAKDEAELRQALEAKQVTQVAG